MLEDPDFSTFVQNAVFGYDRQVIVSEGDDEGYQNVDQKQKSKIEIIKVFRGVNDAIFVQKIKLE